MKNSKKALKDYFIIEKILDVRELGNKKEYLVHWQDYDISEATWQPMANLSYAQQMVQQFQKERKELQEKSRDQKLKMDVVIKQAKDPSKNQIQNQNLGKRPRSEKAAKQLVQLDEKAAQQLKKKQIILTNKQQQKLQNPQTLKRKCLQSSNSSNKSKSSSESSSSVSKSISLNSQKSRKLRHISPSIRKKLTCEAQYVETGNKKLQSINSEEEEEIFLSKDKSISIESKQFKSNKNKNHHRNVKSIKQASPEIKSKQAQILMSSEKKNKKKKPSLPSLHSEYLSFYGENNQLILKIQQKYGKAQSLKFLKFSNGQCRYQIKFANGKSTVVASTVAQKLCLDLLIHYLEQNNAHRLGLK